MNKIPFSFIMLIVCLTGRIFNICADERVFSSIPYEIRIYVFGDIAEKSQSAFAAMVSNRCRIQTGQLWNVSIEFPSAETAVTLRRGFPENGEGFDKIFIAEFDCPQQLQIQEFDVKTHWRGRKAVYELDHPTKAVDVLLQALFELFSPIARLEKAAADTATLRVQGADIDSLTMLEPAHERHSVAGIPMKQGILLPFVRSYDRDGKLLNVSRISWTALAAEQVEPVSNLLRCRIESSMRNGLGMRRRGQTEIYALSVPTPMQPTTLRLKPRINNGEKTTEVLQTLPVYDVFEAVPGEKKLQPLGQTRTDGTFVLTPIQERPLRTVMIRSGHSLIAQIPVVRGQDWDCIIPIPDAAVRLEAEAAVLGIQEDMIDTAARRSILDVRLKKFEESKDEKMIRETRNDLAKLKDNDRFLIELEQARLRYKSEDSVVQRQIDRLFRNTKKAVGK